MAAYQSALLEIFFFFRFFRVATTWHWEALRLQEAGIFFGVRCRTGRI